MFNDFRGNIMTKMEIELNDEQLEKVKKLEAHNISVGDAIDMLFEARDRVISIIDDIDEKDLEDDTPNTEETEAEQTQLTGKTYDIAIEDYKSHISWANDFFKL